MDHGDKIGMRTKKTVVKMTALLTVLFLAGRMRRKRGSAAVGR